MGGQAAFLMAGWSGAWPERRPLGRPGERPPGCGARACVPSAASSAATACGHARHVLRGADGAAAAGRAAPDCPLAATERDPPPG